MGWIDGRTSILECYWQLQQTDMDNSNQCPFTVKYVPILEELARTRNAAFQSIHIQTRADAQNAPRSLQPFPFSMTGSL